MNKKISSFLLLLMLSFGMQRAQAQIDFTVGTGTTGNTNTGTPTPYNDYYEGSRAQFLFLASELTAAGMSAGNITAVKWNVTNTNTATVHELFEVKIGSTTTSTLTSWVTGLTTVVTGANYTPSTGTNTHAFSSSFFWDGVSNIVVETCHGDPSNTSGASQWSYSPSVNFSTVSFNGSLTYRSDNSGSLCGTTSSGSTSTSRPNTTFSLIASAPCNSPAPARSNITSSTATVTWGAITSATSYDYALTTSSTPPTTGISNTTATTVSFTGLTPSTLYYFHIRTKCTSPSMSPWNTIQVPTNPPCKAPDGFRVARLTTNEALVTWRRLAHAVGYQYVLDQQREDPGSGAFIVNTSDSFFNARQLQEGTKYYVHKRSACAGNETSSWSLDSFTTLIVCRAPELMINDIVTDRAIIYWNPVRSAVNYEYEISQVDTPRGDGTKIDKTSFQAFPLKDGQVYYFHVRSSCSDQNIASKSGWGTIAFRTIPTGLSSVQGEEFKIEAYPNPVKNTLSVKLGSATGTRYGSLALTDMSGRTHFTTENVTATSEIDMTAMPSGIYFLKYTDGNFSKVIKVTKQ